jgi:hypothetical protein
MNSSKKNDDAFNGVNTQVLNTVYNSMQNQLEMAKATFSVNHNGMVGSVLHLASKASYWRPKCRKKKYRIYNAI